MIVDLDAVQSVSEIKEKVNDFSQSKPTLVMEIHGTVIGASYYRSVQWPNNAISHRRQKTSFVPHYAFCRW